MDRSFRKREKKLRETANKLVGECNAQVAVVAVNPRDNRVVRHSSPNMEEVLRSFGYETQIPDALQRFGATLNEVTANVFDMNANQLNEFNELVADLTRQVQEAQRNHEP